MEWQHSGSTHPKKFCVQKSAGSVLALIFGIKTASSSLSSKGPNYPRRVLLISAGATEGHFEGKTTHHGKVTKEVLFLHDNAPGTCNPQETGLPGFQCLD